MLYDLELQLKMYSNDESNFSVELCHPILQFCKDNKSHNDILP